MESQCVYLSLGGNQGNALLCLKQAVEMLVTNTSSISDLKVSHFYRTEPLYFETPHWFVNAVCCFVTNLSLLEVYALTRMIEKALGKVDKAKNEDRPIDIDLLFYGTQQCKMKELEIPHPRWKERLFVLIPLADLTNEICLQTAFGLEHFVIADMIRSLTDDKHQAVSLLT